MCLHYGGVKLLGSLLPITESSSTGDTGELVSSIVQLGTDSNGDGQAHVSVYVVMSHCLCCCISIVIGNVINWYFRLTLWDFADDLAQLYLARVGRHVIAKYTDIDRVPVRGLCQVRLTVCFNCNHKLSLVIQASDLKISLVHRLELLTARASDNFTHCCYPGLDKIEMNLACVNISGHAIFPQDMPYSLRTCHIPSRHAIFPQDMP